MIETIAAVVPANGVMFAGVHPRTPCTELTYSIEMGTSYDPLRLGAVRTWIRGLN